MIHNQTRRESGILVKMITLLALSVVSACSPREAVTSVHETKGTEAERIVAVSRLVSTHAPLPSALLDARFVEQQVGDGVLGPSDFIAFYVLTVEPADLGVWRAALAPLNMKPEYAAPWRPFPWWVALEDFRGLEFYSPDSLTGRHNGWAGISPDGRIFVYAFTM